ncbi:MAG TPA: helix-turn-helix transcriptional regulator [Acidimicrobiales bacterium]|nr:helix-turn-helix transcriptional regulator [Acidimicrobiales bacterium]
MHISRKQLGRQIREAREATGMTLRAAAERLGIDSGYYSRIETGQNPVGKHARKIAKLYGLNADELEAQATTKLPNYRPYLRAKFDLPDEAIAELEAHFEAVTKQHARGRRRQA